MKVTVDVTRNHIQRGTRSNCGYCPIALAIKEIIKGPYDFSVRAASICFTKRSYQLPESAQNFICDFDAGWKVIPFSFELDIGEEYLKAA